MVQSKLILLWSRQQILNITDKTNREQTFPTQTTEDIMPSVKKVHIHYANGRMWEKKRDKVKVIIKRFEGSSSLGSDSNP